MKGKKKKINGVALIMFLIMLIFVSSGIGYVIAQMTSTLGIGGNISFSGGNVYATISKGAISNGVLANADTKLQAIVYDMNSDVSPETALATWSNLDIAFNETAEDITISFTITNNHTERNLKVSVGTPTGTYVNVSRSIKINNIEMTDANSVAVLEKEGACALVVITFSINDKNKSAKVEGFSFGFSLVNTDESATISATLYRYTEDGTGIYFGKFPQTIKASGVTIISSADSNGYYTGSDGEKYAKNTTVDYYSLFDEDASSEDIEAYLKYTKINFASDGTKMESCTDYYFKVEDLEWKILSTTDSNVATVICTSVLRSHVFQSNYKSYTKQPNGESQAYTFEGAIDENGEFIKDEDGNIVDANNYQYSELREYLINEFYDTTFSDSQKKLIQYTHLEESYDNYNIDDTVYVLSDDEFNDFFCNDNSEINWSKYLNYGFAPTDYAKTSLVGVLACYFGDSVYDILGYINMLNDNDSEDITYDECTSTQKDALDAFYASGLWWSRSCADNNYGDNKVFAFPVGRTGTGGEIYGVVPVLQIQL